MWNSEPPVSYLLENQIIRISYMFCLSPLSYSFYVVKLSPFQLLTRRDLQSNPREWVKLSFANRSGSTLLGLHLSFCLIMKKPAYRCAGSNVQEFWHWASMKFLVDVMYASVLRCVDHRQRPIIETSVDFSLKIINKRTFSVQNVQWWNRFIKNLTKRKKKVLVSTERKPNPWNWINDLYYPLN